MLKITCNPRCMHVQKVGISSSFFSQVHHIQVFDKVRRISRMENYAICSAQNPEVPSLTFLDTEQVTWICEIQSLIPMIPSQTLLFCTRSCSDSKCRMGFRLKPYSGIIGYGGLNTQCPERNWLFHLNDIKSSLHRSLDLNVQRKQEWNWPQP